MDIQIDGVKVNRALLDVFGMMLSNPDRSLSLVHIPSQQQISVNGGADGQFLLSASIEQTTQWTRDQYWWAEDLERFNRDWVREMSPDSDQWFEYRYKIDSMAPIQGRPVQQPDHELVSQYRLITGPNSTMFHLGENLGMEAIA